MRFLLGLICSVLLLSNLGCMNQHANITKSSDPKQCLAQCTQRFESCKTLCVNNCAVCSAKANQNMVENYSEYVHEEQVEGGYVMRGLKSYRDPLQCRKVTCNCYADLITCEQNCTGIIHKQLRAVPYCT
jgi:hypothetical protein